MIGKPMYSAELRAAEAGLKAFCEAPLTAEVVINLLLLGRNYWPTHGANGSLEGVKLSDLYRIQQKLGVPGDYETAIGRAVAFEEGVRCQV